MFPHNTALGVSSAINLSHDERYLIYNKVNYAGVEAALQRNAWYPLPSEMGLANDSLQSIRKEWTKQKASLQYFALDLNFIFFLIPG